MENICLTLNKGIAVSLLGMAGEICNKNVIKN